MQNKPILFHATVYHLGELKCVAFNVNNIASIVEFDADSCKVFTVGSSNPHVVNLGYSDLMKQLNEVIERASYPVADNVCSEVAEECWEQATDSLRSAESQLGEQ